MRRASHIASLLLALLLLGLGSAIARADSCTEAAVSVEAERDLPPGLLQAISLTESGFDGTPHPYALRIGGRSFYPATAEQAEKLLVPRRGRPVHHANVGCMQLSLAGYGWAFGHHMGILEPEANMRMAAEYLVDWMQARGSWTAAVMRYQGGTPRAQQAYVCRVWSYLRVLQPTSADVLDAGHCASTAEPRIDPRTIALGRHLRQAAQN